ncbi:hypothetical protein BCR44DRAFT_1432907 [Catenaria anguillulae PL171]|uniref:F-box domain-containing protein n=1 Tax=Catenaria anguillulae PL171 TaxID=765915 RepID=A0A1Y2HNL8_9FUNG|nr:hypothetical protein BCR44DRAFT_1432907 [Catenaria anguillulae PL171]
MERLPSELIALVGCYCDPLSLHRLVASSKWLRAVLARSPQCWRVWPLRKVLVLSLISPGGTDPASAASNHNSLVGADAVMAAAAAAEAEAAAAAASAASTSSLAMAAFYDTLVMRYLRCLDKRPSTSLLVPSVVHSPTTGRVRLSWVSIGEILSSHVQVLDLSNTPIAFSVWDVVKTIPNIRILNLAFCYHLRLGIPSKPMSSDPEALPITAGTIVLKKLIKHCTTSDRSACTSHHRHTHARCSHAHHHPLLDDQSSPTLDSSPSLLPHLRAIRLRDTDVITSTMLSDLNHLTRLHVADVVECRTCGEIIPGAQTCRMPKCPRLVDICAACEDDSLNCDWSECESGAFLARICSACRPGLPQIPRAYNPPGYTADGSLVLDAPGICERGAWATALGQRLPIVKVPEGAFIPPGADAGDAQLGALMPVCPDRLTYFYCPRHRRVLANCPVCYAKWACNGCGLGYCWECWNWNFVKVGELCWTCRSMGVAPPSHGSSIGGASIGMANNSAFGQQLLLQQSTSSQTSSDPGSTQS